MPPEAERIEHEREVLRILCQGTLPREFLVAARDTLRQYRFLHPVHQLLWEALQRFAGADFRHFREQLPALLTNMGFPDVDLAPFLAPLRFDEADVLSRIQQLAAQDPAAAIPPPKES